MIIKLYVFITDTDGGTDAEVYTKPDMALAAYYSFAISKGYNGLRTKRGIDKWRTEVYEESGVDTFYIKEEEILAPELVKQLQHSELSRCHHALHTCIKALDMDDQFGDDIDARHAAEEEAFHAAKAALPDPYPTSKYFLVIGHALDEETSWRTFLCETGAEAIDLWRSWMRNEGEATGELFIDHVYESVTPISGVHLEDEHS